MTQPVRLKIKTTNPSGEKPSLAMRQLMHQILRRFIACLLCQTYRDEKRPLDPDHTLSEFDE
jgi:hypothetical protein